MATKIDPRRIRTDLDTQIRVDWNEEAVKEYAELMERGIEFPPLLVFFDEPNNQFILADGFHRLAAHNRVKPNDFILVEQRLGNVEDARWAAIIANQSHGIRRTNNDKHNAVKQALIHPKGTCESNRKIAEYVGVVESTVRVVRHELELTARIAQSNSRTGRDGRTINTAGINAGRSQTDESPETPKTETASNYAFTVNTSRINFGGKVIPDGANCGNCRYFENQKCLTDEIESPLPWSDVCNEYAVRVIEPPPEVIAPPDYENAKPLGRKLKRKRLRRLHKNRDLKNCIAVYLPSNHPEMFAVELRDHWPKPYLIECLSALKQLLEEDDYADEEDDDDDEDND